MHWPFRSLRTLPPASPSFASPPSCNFVEPLLPLYADGMASPDEVRRVEAHLPGCESCREALFWMQATHRALAARPVAVPPADLQSRIAEAIAASSAAPITLRPARSFTLRPAYAAAASLTVLGAILSHSLLHSPVPSVPNVSAVKPAPPIVASVPTTPHSVVPHKALAKTTRTKTSQALVARNVPAAAIQHDAPKSLVAQHAPKKTLPVNVVTPQERVANNVPASPHAFVLPHASVPTHVQVKPVHSPAALPHNLIASGVSPAEKRHPAVSEPAIIKHKTDLPMLARHDKEPLPVPVHIEPSTVTEQPTTRMASSSRPSNLSAVIGAHLIAMHDAPLDKTTFTTRQAYLTATNAMHALDTEHFGYLDAIHGRRTQ